WPAEATLKPVLRLQFAHLLGREADRKHGRSAAFTPQHCPPGERPQKDPTGCALAQVLRPEGSLKAAPRLQFATAAIKLLRPVAEGASNLSRKRPAGSPSPLNGEG